MTPAALLPFVRIFLLVTVGTQVLLVVVAWRPWLRFVSVMHERFRSAGAELPPWLVSLSKSRLVALASTLPLLAFWWLLGTPAVRAALESAAQP